MPSDSGLAATARIIYPVLVYSRWSPAGLAYEPLTVMRGAWSVIGQYRATRSEQLNWLKRCWDADADNVV
ncbi:MAG: hypothetical protein HC818_04280 [Synechococcaceae cyanobacterium RM1_1_27]|nr:hypothetical protein [Synechococcaceae cyanobacterium RM1_1_27]